MILSESSFSLVDFSLVSRVPCLPVSSRSEQRALTGREVLQQPVQEAGPGAGVDVQSPGVCSQYLMGSKSFFQ